MQKSLMRRLSDYEEIIFPAQNKSLSLSLSPLSDPTFLKIKNNVVFVLHFLAFVFVLTVRILPSLVHLT